MTMLRAAWPALAFGLLLSAASARAQDDVTLYQTEAPFEDVAFAVNDAIINLGYVIDHHGDIGEMLARTAEDVGADRKLYRDAEFFQFCSAVVSRRVMEQDVANIAYCPYIVFVYETEAEPGVVKVGFRRLPEGGGRDEVNEILDGIAREAAGQ
ncbi:DUF302 domain-containing protein [Chelativorans sp. SCAU2101]|jgi:uncharacterized protein (DUF302 family)|uniref:DUF302 domain-containing protein n=1 Tax=Chelativorans petroleitrophicus TaxID=2975484 RepID=A0A9X3AYY6_9HYPH|nr:DUF302 domain-containing protein [Chelativorans petroleitrophicus]MCT8988909.1 DUF302 domain-containing protein [Chelativorans petroleitrophicus]